MYQSSLLNKYLSYCPKSGTWGTGIVMYRAGI
uniref:Uncharacterized protein n=1 Tax=Anguilla anguilla TaxID=7936 RepID=A0A0E9RNC6_ANGAN